MPKELETPSGKIIFSDELFISIVRRVVPEVRGVVGTASRRLRDDVVGLLRRDHTGRGIEVRMRDEGPEIAIDVVIEYGVRISEVAHDLVQAVRKAVRDMTGIEVEQVLVRVQGLSEAQTKRDLR